MTRCVLIAISVSLAVSEFWLERQLQILGLTTVTGAILAALVSGSSARSRRLHHRLAAEP